MLLALSLGWAGGALALPREIALSSDQQVALGVRLQAVQPAGAVVFELPAQVTVPAANQAVVAAPAPGVVEKLLVSTGDAVRKGQVLAELRSAELAQLQRDRAQAQTQLDLARKQAQREETLVHEGIVPAARLDAARAQQAQAQAALAERDLAVRLAAGGAALNGVAVLRAPVEGVVASVDVLPGQRVDMGAPLLHLQRAGALALQVQATAAQAAALPLGAAVQVADRGAAGDLVAKAPALGAGQSVTLRVHLRQPGNLVAGETVKARIAVPAQPGLWRVPPASVVDMGGQTVVFAASAKGFAVVPVTVRARLDDAVLVQGALRAGQQVAASGVVAIKAAAGEEAP